MTSFLHDTLHVSVPPPPLTVTPTGLGKQAVIPDAVFSQPGAAEAQMSAGGFSRIGGRTHCSLLAHDSCDSDCVLICNYTEESDCT